MPWKRLGDCPPERCQGRCCEHVGIWFGDDDAARAFLEVLRVRGVHVLDLPDEKGATHHLVRLNQRCQHLTLEGLCGLYGTPERPQFCSDWPQEPGQLVNDPACGFRFEWIEE